MSSSSSSTSLRLVIVLLVLVAVGLVAFAASMFLGGGGEDDPASTSRRPTDPAPRSEPPTPPAPTPPGPVEPPDVPAPPPVSPHEGAPPARKPAPLPLSDVVVPDLSWNDVEGVEALHRIAAYAGKNLTWGAGAKQIMEKVRVTMELDGASAAKAFDLLTQRHGLYWTIRPDSIEIYVDDGD